MHHTGLPFALPVEREIQTHANLVVLTAERAYKLKKPVKFPFLDYSTLALRRQMILNELHLNRRFAPDIYLGVAEVREREGKLALGELRDDLPEPTAGVQDYCVVMKRIPDDAWLPALMRDGKLDERHIIALMRALVQAYRAEQATEQVRAAGLPANLRHNTLANIAECEPFVPECLTRERWQRLDALLRGWFERNPEVFEARVAQDRIRDGHGDLKPGNIAFVDGRPIITDCIEFNPLFRRLDTLCEVAFLATGLESLGAFEMAVHVFNAYREVAEDEYPEALRRYYQAHLACVMGKVTALQLNEPEVPVEQKHRAREQAATHFALADFHAREPHVVVVMGIMGCGKSTVANAIGAHFGWPVVNSDVERKRLCGVSPSDRLPQEAYSREMSVKVYDALYEAAGRAGSGIVLDAQFGLAAGRKQAIEAATRAGGHALFVHCDAPDDVVRERMKRRVLDPSRVSDATADLLEQARSRFELPSAGEGLELLQFDTRNQAAESVKAVLQRLL
ncbi:MAG: AAA family ATPase [Planctomycetes bacterium]|nr:AAA family ATPase [Planctomycetota bacterium]MCB9936179.1 AAA family ATPase [Planctomycetota bacterium]